MAAETRTVPIAFRLGDVILENGEPKIDPETQKPMRGEPVPIKFADIVNLTSKQAMDAEDFAVADSPTGMPSDNNRLRAFAICALRKLGDEIIVPPASLEAYERIRDKLDRNELFELGKGWLKFSADLNRLSDPNDSPSGAQSPQ